MTPLDRWKKLALSLAIIIVLNVFFNVGVETFYPAPQYDDFCPTHMVTKGYETVESCQEEGGNWVEPTGGPGYCDVYTKCNTEFNEATKPHNRNAFVVLTSLGVITLLVGLLTQGMPMAVANGLLYGGVLSMIIGTTRYWTYMDDYLRFIVSGVALFILILVGIKKLKD